MLSKAPQLQRLLSNELKTNFDSITLWAYRPGVPDSPFCDKSTLPLPPSFLADETKEFAELTLALMALPGAGAPTSFWLESWENDWATRCGSYAHQPASAEVLVAYGDWLRARQAGVEQGREMFCRSRGGGLQQSGGTQTSVVTDCTDQAAVTAAARINVYMGAEVNLVGECITNRSCGNIVTAVLPVVPLDYVSYSSYDTMRTPQLADALDLIDSLHKRTAASPERSLFITEFGVPETTTDPKVTRQVRNKHPMK